MICINKPHARGIPSGTARTYIFISYKLNAPPFAQPT